MSPLRRRMIEDMQIRNLTPNTQRVYVSQVVRFACHFGQSPERLGPAEIRAYLLHLTRERRLAASSIIVTVSALRFVYAVTLKRPWIIEDDIPTGRQAKKLPVVLSRDEVARFLGTVANLKHRVILTVCYATGLRISEAVRLRPTAIDSKRMVIRVEQGKGRKDRYAYRRHQFVPVPVHGITPHDSPVLFVCDPVNIPDMMIADEDAALFGGAHCALTFLKPAVDQPSCYRTPCPDIGASIEGVAQDVADQALRGNLPDQPRSLDRVGR